MKKPTAHRLGGHEPHSTTASLALVALSAQLLVLPVRATEGPVGNTAGSHYHPEQTRDASEERPLYTCGMHPQVIRDQPGSCPICGMELTPLRRDVPRNRSDERRILYWWDPMMSPPYISDRPGKSPMGMDLVPVYADSSPPRGAIVIDPTIVQNMGVRVATAEEGPLVRTIRAAGTLAEAEPNQHDVNLRISGWVERLYVDVEGMHTHAGDPLFDLYSPELQVAIEDLIAARRARERLGTAGVHGGAPALVETAEQKLELLGIPRAQARELGRLERAPRTVTFRSPVSGHVIEKPIVQGSAVEAGMRALRIVDHSSLWLDIAIYEQQLPFVRLGQRVRATILALPGKEIEGTVSFLHPHVDMTTRAAIARVVVANDVLQLRPGMFATVEIASELSPRTLLVPLDAVIDTGTEQVVFLALPEGHFAPRRVIRGPVGDDGRVQILSGLSAGERVVTSGQFLLDAESRFREAVARFLAKDLLADQPASGGDGEHAAHGERTSETTRESESRSAP